MASSEETSPLPEKETVQDSVATAAIETEEVSASDNVDVSPDETGDNADFEIIPTKLKQSTLGDIEQVVSELNQVDSSKASLEQVVDDESVTVKSQLSSAVDQSVSADGSDLNIEESVPPVDSEKTPEMEETSVTVVNSTEVPSIVVSDETEMSYEATPHEKHDGVVVEPESLTQPADVENKDSVKAETPETAVLGVNGESVEEVIDSETLEDVVSRGKGSKQRPPIQPYRKDEEEEPELNTTVLSINSDAFELLWCPDGDGGRVRINIERFMRLSKSLEKPGIQKMMRKVSLNAWRTDPMTDLPRIYRVGKNHLKAATFDAAYAQVMKKRTQRGNITNANPISTKGNEEKMSKIEPKKETVEQPPNMIKPAEPVSFSSKKQKKKFAMEKIVQGAKVEQEEIIMLDDDNDMVEVDDSETPVKESKKKNRRREKRRLGTNVMEGSVEEVEKIDEHPPMKKAKKMEQKQKNTVNTSKQQPLPTKQQHKLNQQQKGGTQKATQSQQSSQSVPSKEVVDVSQRTFPKKGGQPQQQQPQKQKGNQQQKGNQKGNYGYQQPQQNRNRGNNPRSDGGPSQSQNDQRRHKYNARDHGNNGGNREAERRGNREYGYVNSGNGRDRNNRQSDRDTVYPSHMFATQRDKIWEKEPVELRGTNVSFFQRGERERDNDRYRSSNVGAVFAEPPASALEALTRAYNAERLLSNNDRSVGSSSVWNSGVSGSSSTVPSALAGSYGSSTYGSNLPAFTYRTPDYGSILSNTGLGSSALGSNLGNISSSTEWLARYSSALGK